MNLFTRLVFSIREKGSMNLSGKVWLGAETRCCEEVWKIPSRWFGRLKNSLGDFHGNWWEHSIFAFIYLSNLNIMLWNMLRHSTVNRVHNTNIKRSELSTVGWKIVSFWRNVSLFLDIFTWQSSFRNEGFFTAIVGRVCFVCWSERGKITQFTLINFHKQTSAI